VNGATETLYIITRFFKMRLLLIFFLFIGFKSMSQTEEQNYNVLKTLEDVQIREYDPVIYASVSTDNERSLFRILAGYIFGGNENNQKIAMTAPVHMQESSSEKEKKYTMKFVMPSKYTLDNLSKPNDPRIIMEKVSKKKYAAISYSGYNNSSKFSLNSTKLRKILDENNISYKDNPIYLGYDAPYKVWGRKNDVLLELTE